MYSIGKYFLFFLLLTLGVSTSLSASAPPASIAFFYGANPPWSELQVFDLLVVDPGHVSDPKLVALPLTRLAAYVALGEVQHSRPYASSIPKTWFVGENQDWGSRLIDQSQPEWPLFFADRVVGPLWDKGYRTFFLDTLDSYQLFAKTPEQRAAQESGMVAVVTALAQRYPAIRLVFNRGFEILAKTHQHVEMVVAESLFQGYDAGKKRYINVSAQDRAWLLTQLQRAKDEYKLLVAAVDYVSPANRELARQTAKRIAELGLIPWVATPDLASVGVGSIETMPRKVLVVHSALDDEHQLRWVAGLRLGALPINHLGYVPEYVDSSHLPQDVLPGRYAGVVIWLTEPPSNEERMRLTQWLTAQVEAAVPVALVNPPEFLLGGPMSKVLGLRIEPVTESTNAVEIVQQSEMMGFEAPPRPGAAEFVPITVRRGEALLTLKQGKQIQVAAALTPWGGYAMENFAIVSLPGNGGDRWVINPFLFFQQALRLPAMPVPDVTTESGRRMLMVHMDGDGFVSRSELPGNPMAGELVLSRIVKKYPVPMTISVIEAELSPHGLYPSLSSAAENVARDIFKQSNVAIASHSYSHPFVWSKAAVAAENEGYNLRLPGYRFDLQREIEGSIRYIEERLAPAGKKVEMFLWTGDCIPGSDALGLTQKAGVMNMNGGDTVATRSQPTVSQVEGLGVPRKAGFQVYAPNQNEGVYTHDWRGPFYGYERVIETFEFTETPRRLKPIDIYFHTYITAKAAGMKSLDKVFGYALSQEITPVYVADYARKVLDFQGLTVAKTPTGWRVRGARHLRTLRLPSGVGWPDIASSQSVAGFTHQQDEPYVHLSADSAELILTPHEIRQPRLVSANAQIDKFEKTSQGFRWELSGHVPVKFSLAHASGCQVRVAGRPLRPLRSAGDVGEFEIKEHVAKPLEAICRS